jgi:hypothetical protein
VNKRHYLLVIIAIVFTLIGIKGYLLFEATQPNAIVYWQVSDEQNIQTVNHALFDEFLSNNIVDNEVLRTVNYKNVSVLDKKKLTTYLMQLQSIDPRHYSKDEQLAYWVNLYNALVVNLVLAHYPIDSIKDIGDGFTGPWNIELVTIAGMPITLNKIEHGILRPLWKDSRIHYVINCASTGCPDLPTKAFISTNIDKQLNSAAIRFVNQKKGVNIVNNTITLSSIYKWFSVDFGSSQSSLLKHINTFALPPLKNEIERFSENIEFEYDWTLNETNTAIHNKADNKILLETHKQ